MSEEIVFGVYGFACEVFADNVLMSGIHGFSGVGTDDKFGIIKSRILTTNGYETRAQQVASESVCLKPLFYTDIYTSCVVEDDAIELATIESFTKLVGQLVILSEVGPRTISHENGFIQKGMRNKGTERLKTNTNAWKKLYELIDREKITVLYTIDVTKKLTAANAKRNPYVNSTGIIARAGEIARLSRSTATTPFDSLSGSNADNVDMYWKCPNVINPLVGFKEKVFYTRGDDDKYVHYLVNRGKDFINIGRKSEHCGYGVVRLYDDDLEDIEAVKTFIKKATPDQPMVATVRLESLRILPGLVLADIKRFDTRSMYADVDTGVVTSMHNKIVGSYAVTPAMSMKAVDIITHLENVMNILEATPYGKGDPVENKNYSITNATDITDLFVMENDKGVKVPTPELNLSKGFMSIKLEGKRKRNLMLGNEIIERNMLVKLVKKDLNIRQVTFKIAGEDVERICYVVKTSEGIGVYNNWYISIIV